MDINGLQKLTLLDFPGHTACTVFLAGCNMKCPFCHNSILIDGSAFAEMSDEELYKFLEKRKAVLDGVAFTGGEPTLRNELPSVMRKIKSMGYSIKLDTNGSQPKVLKYMLDEKLVDYVAMDIKNSPDKYALSCGTANINMDDIKESISLLIHSDIDYEFRTTVVDQLHDKSSFEEIAQMIKGAKRYFLQAFKDRDSVPFAGFSAPPKEKLEEYAAVVSAVIPDTQIRGVD